MIAQISSIYCGYYYTAVIPLMSGTFWELCSIGFTKCRAHIVENVKITVY